MTGVRKRVFVFPMLDDGTFLSHQDDRVKDESYIPAHVSSDKIDSIITLGYTALDRCRIIGDIRDDHRYMRKERGEFHYLLANVNSHNSALSKPFTVEQIENYGEHKVASWVPEMMREMGLLV